MSDLRNASTVEPHKKSFGVGCAVVAGFSFFVTVSMCTLSDGSGSAGIAAENKRKGLHCLSEWDGSNTSTVAQIKPLLRNPDSFEHIETRIMPLDKETGEHGLTMRYRAENGFGGITASTAFARIDHKTCNSTIQLDGLDV